MEKLSPKPMYLILVCMFLTIACAKNGSNSSGGASESPNAVLPAPATPAQTPTSCNDDPACVNACMVAHPYYPSSQLVTDLCGGISTGSTCATFTTPNNQSIAANSACLELPVDQVLTSTGSTVACSLIPTCSQLCMHLYPATTVEAIERSLGANSGATLKAIYSNELLTKQQTACLQLPAGRMGF